ncbi:hypothetical protein JXJ21_15265 [candidate division KSB1 bacterium]|nr:hypothetical protein [candidate division KSB1 bacterium]
MKIQELKIILSLSIIMFSTPGFNLARAQDSRLFGRTAIGMEVGTWKPNKLSTRNDVSSILLKGTSPYYGVFFLVPAPGDWTLRGGMGYWNQTTIENVPDTKSVTILHFILALKQVIIPEFRLSPFVSYGFTFYIGSKNETNIKRIILHKKKEAGYGANVGAGFDFLISTHWVAGLEFCYNYVKFNRVIGMTEDYSGPKVSINLLYSF